MQNSREFLGGASVLAASPRVPGQKPAGPRFFVAALTALDSKLKLDEGLARDLLAYYREAGVDGTLVCNTTGEFHSFSVKAGHR